MFATGADVIFLSLLTGIAVAAGTKDDHSNNAPMDAEWLHPPSDPADRTGNGKILKDIPQYVIDYAPLVHLYSGEPFWPGLMDQHLEHTTPYLNDMIVDEFEQNLSLDELGKLNAHLPPWYLYLRSNDHVKNDHPWDFPEWLIGEANIPTESDKDGHEDSDDDEIPKTDSDDWSEWFDVGAPGENANLDKPDEMHSAVLPANLSDAHYSSGGKSAAPIVLIVVEKDNGVVDAFWFYFYHYNLGNAVFRIRFGNHVGDWEHNMIRFHNGVPKAVFYSEHAGGSSYTYDAVEKIGKRPRVYSASGTHAMYATQGIHPYVLPFRILHDTTDRGPLWDPLQNLFAYHYNTTLAGEDDRTIWSVNGENVPSVASEDKEDPLTLTPSSLTPNIPTSWFYYRGHWGDKNFNKSDPRQYAVFGEKAYVSGPMGPRWKALGRRMVCPNRFTCSVKTSIQPLGPIAQFAIDMLKLCGFLLILAGIVSGIVYSLRCCIYCGRKGTRRFRKMRLKREGDEEEVIAVIVEDEVDEESPLLTDAIRNSGIRGHSTTVDKDRLDGAGVD